MLQTGKKLDLDDGVKLNFVAQLGWHFRISRKAEVELRKHGNSYTCLETRKDGGNSSLGLKLFA